MDGFGGSVSVQLGGRRVLSVGQGGCRFTAC